MDKVSLRKQFLSIRAAIKDKPAKSIQIMEKVLSSRFYKHARVVAVFASMPLEVDTQRFVTQAWADGKTVAFPRVEGNDLSFYSATSYAQLTPSGNLGIREPSPLSNPKVSKTSIELILVPGLCFDQNNHRLGHGKGFYDRYLKDCPAYKIGVCFAEQRYPGLLPITPTDVAVDEVVSG